jgi:hypothetical protein
MGHANFVLPFSGVFWAKIIYQTMQTWTVQLNNSLQKPKSSKSICSDQLNKKNPFQKGIRNPFSSLDIVAQM